MWSYSAGSIVYSSPAVSDGIVFVASFGGMVYAIDEYSGATIWSYWTGQYIVASPAVSNGMVFITTECPYGGGAPLSCKSGYVYAFNEFSGSLAWQQMEGSPLISSPLVANGKVIYGTYTLGNGQVSARDIATGTQIWRTYLLGDAVAAPLSADGNTIFVDEIDGSVVALNDSNNGAQIWKVVLSGAPIIQTAPAVGYGRVFLGTATQGVFALNEQNGGTLWQFKTGGYNTTSVALGAGIAYFGTGRGVVYAVNATTNISTGSQIWIYPKAGTIGPVASSPAVAQGSNTLLFGSVDHNLYALSASTGSKIWNYATGNSVYSSPSVANGRAFFGSEDGKVYAIGAAAPKLHVSVTSNSTSLMSDQGASLTIIVTNGTSPLPGANLTFTSSQGGTFSSFIDSGWGSYMANFTAPIVNSKVTANVTVTASLAGYVSGGNWIGITIDPLPLLTVAVSPKPSSITPGGEITLMIKVTNGTLLIAGASLQLSSNQGGSFSSISDGGNGNYTAVFDTPFQSSDPVVTVRASKAGFTSGQGQTTVAVNGIPNLTTLKVSGIPLFLILAGGIIAFLLIVAVIVRSRKREYHQFGPRPDFSY